MNYRIIPVTAEHIHQMEEIENLCFPDPWPRALLEELLELSGAVSLAAVSDGGLVLGYTSAQTVLDEGYINNVAVRPGYRRQGVASGLLEALRQHGARLGLSFLTLEVRESNKAAQALYAKHGYLEVGCRRNYYEHPKEDAILMTLEFSYDSESFDAGRTGGGL